MHCCRGRLALSFLASSSALDLKRAMLFAQRKMCSTSRVTKSQISYREHAYQMSTSKKTVFYFCANRKQNKQLSVYVWECVHGHKENIHYCAKITDDICFGN